MLKKLLVILSLFTLILSGCGKKNVPMVDDLQQIKDRGRLIVGVRDDTKPFGYRDKDGNLTGLEIELSKKIAGVILGDESKIDFIVVNADDRITYLNSKKVDLLAATMTITRQRLRVLDFSHSYYSAGQAVMVRAKSPYTTFNELADKHLIVVFGTTGEKALRNVYPGAQISAFKTYTEAFEALKNGEADAIVADDTVLLGYAMEDKSVRLFNKRYSREPYAIAFRQGKESQTLQSIVNEYINYLLSSGKLRQLVLKYNLL